MLELACEGEAYGRHTEDLRSGFANVDYTLIKVFIRRGNPHWTSSEDFDIYMLVHYSSKARTSSSRSIGVILCSCANLGSFTSSPKHSGGVRPLAVTNTLYPRGHYRSRTKNTQDRAELHFQGLNQFAVRESAPRIRRGGDFYEILYTNAWVSIPRTSRLLWSNGDIEPIAIVLKTPAKVLPARINVRFRSVRPVYPNGPF
ncbi:hypothetical protein SCHPADRAFT_894550 [Schizopora paradoxa]|uniref:Uncharacterized protein n=1 Tax=Schizopora paradoxa TaxID=27342 RepID=A0A0H2R6W9_9AGAM|nr:hypothetical protein SCHPADRAFT_894550 [Schizopora paradoxa]